MELSESACPEYIYWTFELRATIKILLIQKPDIYQFLSKQMILLLFLVKFLNFEQKTKFCFSRRAYDI